MPGPDIQVMLLRTQVYALAQEGAGSQPHGVVRLASTVVFLPAPAPSLPVPAPSSLQFLSAETSQNEGDDAGQNVSVLPFFNGTMKLSSKERILAEAILKRWQTPRGALPFHPDYGYDLRLWLNKALDSAALYRLKSALEREAEKDERVSSVTVQPAYFADRNSISIKAEVTSEDVSFEFSASVTALTGLKISEGDNV